MEELILQTAYLIVKLNDSNRIYQSNEQGYKKQIEVLTEEVARLKDKGDKK